MSSMHKPSKSGYWLDQIAADIIKNHPEGEIIVSSGVSPSGSYHIGRMREVLTADAIAWALREAGRKARHLHFVDDFDVFRKVPANLPKTHEKYLGMPVYLVPDPIGDCHGSYADHYFMEFMDIANNIVTDIEVLRANQLYRQGKFTDKIEQSLERLDDVKQIITDVSGRKLEEDWVPVQLLSDNNSFKEWSFTGWDKQKQVIKYRARDGSGGELDYTRGRVKLDWRLDWPARWSIWNVTVEPFGKDHATKGSSYDTGSTLIREIFGGTPPYPVPYEFIFPAGESKKISGSAGTELTPGAALEVMPAELLRYFVLRSKPSRTLQFDPGLGLYNLVEEYAKVEDAVESGEGHEFEHAYRTSSAISRTEGVDRIISKVPFTHLVSAYQTSQGDISEAINVLDRTGYSEALASQKKVIEKEFDFVKNWLAMYAPEEVKFEVQKSLPKVELSCEQKVFLSQLAEAIEAHDKPDGLAMHNLIYETKDKAGLSPQEAFQAIYRVILGKESGPKAGWFLASLDKEFLVKRFNEAVK